MARVTRPFGNSFCALCISIFWKGNEVGLLPLSRYPFSKATSSIPLVSYSFNILVLYYEFKHSSPIFTVVQSVEIMLVLNSRSFVS